MLKYRTKWIDYQSFIFDREEPFKSPSLSNHLRTSLRNLAEAKRNGKLVIFVGAGVSIDSGEADWKELTESLKSDLDTKETAFLKIAQKYYEERGKKEYYDKVNSVLGSGSTEPNPLHKKVLELKPLHIVTTNYDSHIEDTIQSKNHSYSIVKKDGDLPYSKHASLYIKMHGDLNERNIVLKESDYGDAYGNNFPLIEGFVKGVFASRLVLFIGFSMRDDNLNQILESVGNILKGDSQYPYLFTASTKGRKGHLTKEQKRRFERVKPILFEKEIESYFQQIKSAEDDEALTKLTSPEGKKLYQFLRVLEVYEPLSDGLEDMSVESQLIASVSRFESLNSIPAHIFEGIAPFRLKRQAENESSSDARYGLNAPFALETLNERLLDFLKKKANRNGKLQIKPSNGLEGKFEKEFNNALR
ncbi:MAG: SIR2 family protein, partial [Flavobacteriales bacterium]